MPSVSPFLKRSHEVVEVAKRLYQKGFLAAADGNISYRISDREILITPSGVSKASVPPEDMALLSLSGEVIQGNPSSEKAMHLQVYQSCPQAKAVVHAHPPVAIAWTIAHPDLKELPSECISELILALGGIPIVPYARPGTSQMGNHLVPFLPKYRAMILARHGAISWGESLEEALWGMERVEHAALILKYAKELGGLSSLPEKEVQFLREQRARMGERIL